MKKLAALSVLLLLATHSPGQSFIPNSNMESWDTISSPAHPIGWQTIDLIVPCAAATSVERTNDAHSGNWAVKMETLPCGIVPWYQYTGWIKLGDTSIQSFYANGGIPFTQRPAFFNFYYKLVGPGQDTADALISFSRLDTTTGNVDPIGAGYTQLPVYTNQYTLVSVPIYYFPTLDFPDSMRIVFSTFNHNDGQWQYLATPGTMLYIDDISLSGGTLGTPFIITGTTFKVHSNPATSHLTISNNGMHSGTAELYDTFGRLVLQQDLQPDETTISTAGLAPGVYVVRISTSDGQYARKVIVQ
jgi:hypothetical protein